MPDVFCFHTFRRIYNFRQLRVCPSAQLAMSDVAVDSRINLSVFLKKSKTQPVRVRSVHLPGKEQICAKSRLCNLEKVECLKYLGLLYLSLVKPHLEYASPVESLPSQRHKVAGKCAKFAFRMITRKWDAGYQELLDILDTPSLETRRLQSTLCTLYKIVHGLCFFLLQTSRPNNCLRTNNLYSLQQPFAHTNAFFIHSFHMPYEPGIHYLLHLYLHL